MRFNFDDYEIAPSVSEPVTEEELDFDVFGFGPENNLAGVDEFFGSPYGQDPVQTPQIAEVAKVVDSLFQDFTPEEDYFSDFANVPEGEEPYLEHKGGEEVSTLNYTDRSDGDIWEHVILPTPARAAAQVVGGVGGGLEFVGDVTGLESLQETGKYLHKQSEEVEAQINIDHPLEEGSWSQAASGALSSMYMQGPFMAMGKLATGVKNAVRVSLGLMSSVVGGQTYGKRRSEGSGVVTSALSGAFDGGVEYLTELLPMDALFTMMKPANKKAAGSVFSTVGKYFGGEFAGESLATFFQDANEKFMSDPNLSMEQRADKFKEYLSSGEAYDNWVQTMKTVTIQSVLMGGGANVVGTLSSPKVEKGSVPVSERFSGDEINKFTENRVAELKSKGKLSPKEKQELAGLEMLPPKEIAERYGFGMDSRPEATINNDRRRIQAALEKAETHADMTSIMAGVHPVDAQWIKDQYAPESQDENLIVKDGEVVEEEITEADPFVTLDEVVADSGVTDDSPFADEPVAQEELDAQADQAVEQEAGELTGRDAIRQTISDLHQKAQEADVAWMDNPTEENKQAVNDILGQIDEAKKQLTELDSAETEGAIQKETPGATPETTEQEPLAPSIKADELLSNTMTREQFGELVATGNVEEIIKHVTESVELHGEAVTQDAVRNEIVAQTAKVPKSARPAFAEKMESVESAVSAVVDTTTKTHEKEATDTTFDFGLNSIELLIPEDKKTYIREHIAEVEEILAEGDNTHTTQEWADKLVDLADIQEKWKMGDSEINRPESEEIIKAVDPDGKYGLVYDNKMRGDWYFTVRDLNGNVEKGESHSMKDLPEIMGGTGEFDRVSLSIKKLNSDALEKEIDKRKVLFGIVEEGGLPDDRIGDKGVDVETEPKQIRSETDQPVLGDKQRVEGEPEAGVEVVDAPVEEKPSIPEEPKFSKETPETTPFKKGDTSLLEAEALNYSSSEELLRSGGLSNENLGRAAFGFSEEDITSLMPEQLNVKWHEDMLNPLEQIRVSGLSKTEWAKTVDLSEPIDVSFENGEFYIEDGHHRYTAAEELGLPLNVKLDIKDNPITALGAKGYDELHRDIYDKATTSHPSEKPKFAKTAPPKKLSALHTLTAENLIFADEIGGLAAPSIAVVKGDMAMEGYGDITLIGTKELADPERVPVYDADAYSATFPTPEYSKAKNKDAEALTVRLTPYKDKYEGNMSYIHDIYSEMAEKGNPEKALRHLVESNMAKAMFLAEEKGSKTNAIMQDVPLSRQGYISTNEKVVAVLSRQLKEKITASKELKKIEANLAAKNPTARYDFEWPMEDRDALQNARIAAGKVGGQETPSGKELISAVEAAIDEHAMELASAKSEAHGTELAEEIEYWREALSKHVITDGSLYGNVAYSLQEDQRKIGKKQVDFRATQKRLDKKLKGKEEEFRTWVEGLVLPLHGEPFLKIGGRKVPYNLENITRKMTSGEISAAEKTMTFGEGKARAAASYRYRNLETLRGDAKTSIGKTADIKGAREAAKQITSEYRDAVVDYYKYDDTWEAFDSSMKAIARFIKSGGAAKAMKKALSSEGFRNVPAHVVEKGVTAAKALATAPVPYFEAKPQRAVSLSEFAGAVIPKGTSKEVKAILDKNGIKYRIYGAKHDEQARAEAVVKLRKTLSRKGEGTLFARTTTPAKSTTAELTAQLDKDLGKKGRKNLGIEVVQSSEGYKDGGVELSAADGTVQGMFNPKTNKITLFADNVSTDKAWATALHESIHKTKAAQGWAGVFGTRSDEIMGLINDKLKANDPAWKAAEQKAIDAGTSAGNVREETITYFIAEGANKGTSLWKRIMNAIRAWAVNMGIKRTLTDADIQAVAEAEIQRLARKGAPVGTGIMEFAQAVGVKLSKATESIMQNPAFVKWFGDSKVVDDNGEPLVVYHGTRTDFSSFDPDKTGGQTDYGWLGKGLYFTPKAGSASLYATVDKDKPWDDTTIPEGSMVLPVYLKAENPFRTDKTVSKSYSDELISQGHDSIFWYKELEDQQPQEIVVFSPTQVKSIFNRGTFDPADPNIMFSKTVDKITKPLQHQDKMAKLIERLRDNAVDTLTKQKELAKYIQQSLPISERGRRELIGQIVKLGIPKTVKTREKYFQQALELVDRKVEQVTKRNTTNKINKLLKQAEPTKASGKPVGKMSAEGHDFILKATTYRNMVPSHAEEQLEKLLESIGPEMDNMTDDQREQLILLSEFTGLTGKSSVELEATLDRLTDIYKTSKLSWKQAEEQRKEDAGEKRAIALDTITGGKDVETQKDKNRSEKDKMWKKLSDGLRGFDDNHQSWAWFLDKISRYSKGETLKGEMTKHFSDMEFTANEEYDTSMRELGDEITLKAQEIYGLTGRKLANKLNENIIVKGKTGVIVHGVEKPLSQNEAYKMWQWIVSPQLAKNMADNGWNDTVRKQLESYMTPEVKAWAEWQIDEFYPKLRAERYNPIYKERFYVDMANIHRYSPMVRDVSSAREDDMLLDSMPSFASEIPGAVKSRTINRHPPKIVDGDSILMNHITQMEHFKAWTKPIQEMRSVITSDSVLGAVDAFHGAEAKKVLKQFVNDFARGGIDRSQNLHGLDALRSNTVVAMIGLNPVVFTKQLTSFPAYMMDMPIKDFIAGSLDLVSNPLKYKEKVGTLLGSEHLKNRYKLGHERDIVAALNKNVPEGIADKMNFRDIFMLPTKVGDAGAIIAGGWSYYKYKYDGYRKTMSEAEAKKKALFDFAQVTNRNQQGARLGEQGGFQRGNSFAKLLTMYITSPQQYYRNVAGGYRNLLAGRGKKSDNLKRIAIAQFILPMTFQFVASGLEWDDEDQLRAVLVGPLNGLFLLRDGISSLMQGLTSGRTYSDTGRSPAFTIFEHTGRIGVEAYRLLTEHRLAEWGDLLDEVVTTLSFPAGVPYKVAKKVTKGVSAAVKGETEHPIRRAMGFSEKSLKKEPPKSTKKEAVTRSRPARTTAKRAAVRTRPRPK